MHKEKDTVLHVSGEYRYSAQLLWKAICQYLSQLQMDAFLSPTTLFLRMYATDIFVYVAMKCIQEFSL